MKKVTLLVIFTLLFSLGFSFAEVPCKINYQGRLIKDNVPVNGTMNMEFKLVGIQGTQYLIIWKIGTAAIL